MHKIPESTAESLLNSIANDQTSSTLVGLSEAVLDSTLEAIVDNDLLKEIPVIGTLVGLTRGVIVYQDRRYMNKILAYLSETSKASQEDRKKYEQKLENNPEESKRAGEIIMDIIDKVTSAEKSIMLGKVFLAYMHEDEMTLQQLIYLSEIIERAYLQDLISLQESDIYNSANLESVGIKSPLRPEDVNKLIATALEAYQRHQDEATRHSRLGLSGPMLGSLLTHDTQMTDAGINLARILRQY